MTNALGPERVVAYLLTPLLADSVYHLTNRVNHKIRLLLMYVMAAVRIRDMPGARHLAHKISPGIKNGSKEDIVELLHFVGRHRSGIDERRKIERLVRGEHDKGHRLKRSRCQYLFKVPPRSNLSRSGYKARVSSEGEPKSAFQ
jgi:hypothetical protein